MKVIKCKNGHFFDGDTYSACPHCGAPVNDAPAVAPVAEEPKKKGFSSLFSREKKTSESRPDPRPEPRPEPQSLVWPEEEPAIPDHREILSQADDRINYISGLNNEPKTIDAWRSGVVAEEPIPQPESSGGSSLRDEVRKASATDEGKTLSYFSVMTGPADPAASAAPAIGSAAPNVPSQAVSSEPVVGWLVCISGSCIGSSFSIYAGKNTIGRGPDNRLVLANDNGISRNKHATVVYEPKKRNFFLQPGDSNGLTYLNDDYIDQSAKLNPRDIIELGSTKLMFVPLCDDSFSWEDYIK